MQLSYIRKYKNKQHCIGKTNKNRIQINNIYNILCNIFVIVTR